MRVGDPPVATLIESSRRASSASTTGVARHRPGAFRQPFNALFMRHLPVAEMRDLGVPLPPDWMNSPRADLARTSESIGSCGFHCKNQLFFSLECCATGRSLEQNGGRSLIEVGVSERGGIAKKGERCACPSCVFGLFPCFARFGFASPSSILFQSTQSPVR